MLEVMAPCIAAAMGLMNVARVDRANMPVTRKVVCDWVRAQVQRSGQRPALDAECQQVSDTQPRRAAL